MQDTNTIARQPILIGLLLSIAVHVAMLCCRAIYVPPTSMLESGRTIVQLTLLSSFPSPGDTTTPQSGILPEVPLESHPQSSTHVVEPSMTPEPRTAPEPVAETTAEPIAPASLDRDATLEEEKGVSTDAVVASPFHPTYPRISRRRGEEGTVALSIQVRANGTVRDVAILRSSGYRRLDEAAVGGAMHTPFKPARRFGRTVESTIELSYTFRLTDD